MGDIRLTDTLAQAARARWKCAPFGTTVGLSVMCALVLSGVACTDRSQRAAADAAKPLTERSYLRVCGNCHLENGRGMPPAYRSLVGSPWVTGSADRAIAIALFGIQAPVVDRTYTYRASMLPYGGAARMTDTDLAAALTYIRTSWGNQASAVTSADVERVRQRFAGRTAGFTQAELDTMQNP